MWDILLLLYINTAPLSLKINKSQRHLFGAVHLFMLRLPLHPWNGLQYNIDIHQYAITAALFGTVLGHHPIVCNHFALICVKITSTDELIEKEDYDEDVEGFLLSHLVNTNIMFYFITRGLQFSSCKNEILFLILLFVSKEMYQSHM